MNVTVSPLQLIEDVTAEQIFKLLPSQATLEQARLFLAGRGLSFSAQSWAAMIDQRLKPALNRNEISLHD